MQSLLPPASPGVSDRSQDPGFRSPGVQGVLSGNLAKLFRFWQRDRVEAMFHREMLYLRDHYEFGAAYSLGDWWLLAYVRRDSPHAPAIRRALRSSRWSDRTSDLAKIFGVDPRRLRD